MNDRRRAWLSLGVMIAFTLMLAATSKAKPDSGKSSSSGTVSDPFGGMPPDVDVVLVTGITLCDKKAATNGCRVLRDFDGADTYIDLPAGKVIWYGESFGLGATGDPSEPFFIDVEKTSTGFGVSARSLIPENPKEKKDAADLLAATKAGRAMSTSGAATFMRGATPPGGLRNMVKTKGRSHVLSEVPAKTYVRRMGDRLLILEYSGSPIGHNRAGGVAALAWVSEAWVLK